MSCSQKSLLKPQREIKVEKPTIKQPPTQRKKAAAHVHGEKELLETQFKK